MQDIQFNQNARWVLLGLAALFFVSVWARTQAKEGGSGVQNQPSAAPQKLTSVDTSQKVNVEKKPSKSQVRSEIVAAIVGSGNECRRFRKIATINAAEEKYAVACSEENEYQMLYDGMSKKWIVLGKIPSGEKADTLVQVPAQLSDST